MNIFAECNRRGIRLAINGDTLKVDAPKGALSPDLLAELKAHKPELLAEQHRTDPVVIPLSTPNGPCKVTVPRDQYDPEVIAAFADRWALIPPTIEMDPRRWRGAEITGIDMRAIEVAAPDDGWGQVYWRQLARAYFPRGHVIHTSDLVDLEDRQNTDAARSLNTTLGCPGQRLSRKRSRQLPLTPTSGMHGTT